MKGEEYCLGAQALRSSVEHRGANPVSPRDFFLVLRGCNKTKKMPIDTAYLVNKRLG